VGYKEIYAASLCPPEEVHYSTGPVYTEKFGVERKEQRKHIEQVMVQFHFRLCMQSHAYPFVFPFDMPLHLRCFCIREIQKKHTLHFSVSA